MIGCSYCYPSTGSYSYRTDAVRAQTYTRSAEIVPTRYHIPLYVCIHLTYQYVCVTDSNNQPSKILAVCGSGAGHRQRAAPLRALETAHVTLEGLWNTRSNTPCYEPNQHHIHRTEAGSATATALHVPPVQRPGKPESFTTPRASYDTLNQDRVCTVPTWCAEKTAAASAAAASRRPREANCGAGFSSSSWYS